MTSRFASAAEMIRSGTTRFFDMYWHSPEVARAALPFSLLPFSFLPSPFSYSSFLTKAIATSPTICRLAAETLSMVSSGVCHEG